MCIRDRYYLASTGPPLYHVGSRWALSSGEERFLDAEESTGSFPVPPTLRRHDTEAAQCWQGNTITIAFLLESGTQIQITTSTEQARSGPHGSCLLYTSDAADDLLCVDLGGRRIIK